MTNQKYKNLTLREFDAAAEKFDDSVQPVPQGLPRLVGGAFERTLSGRTGLWLWYRGNAGHVP